MYRIELLKTHTHASEVHFSGSIIEVDETTATWLIEHGVGKSADAPINTTSGEPATATAKTKSNRKIKE